MGEQEEDAPKTRAVVNECDLIMRGGITSGIVYPSAIARLSEHFRLRSIGGTSAGAIAAAAAAAAECGRRSGRRVNAFERLEQIPDELAAPEKHDGRSRLDWLFQPDAGTKTVYRQVRAAIGGGSWIIQLLRFASSGAIAAPLQSAIVCVFSMVPSGVGWMASGDDDPSWLFYAAVTLNAFLALLFILIAGVVGFVVRARSAIPKNRFGLCSGATPKNSPSLALTDWMHATFQDLAGLPPNTPLTPRELRKHGVDLTLITTNVTRGLSHRYPTLHDKVGHLFFKEKEFREFFPDDVVDHLVDYAISIRSNSDEYDNYSLGNEYHPLPLSEDIPVIIGARLSLSFPILLAQIPLYARHHAYFPSDKDIPLQRCWFSDGGLTSNFPIYLFDKSIPTRPTFGVNLMPDLTRVSEGGERNDQDEPPGSINEDIEDQELRRAWKMIYMPTRNHRSATTRHSDFESAESQLLGFADALIDTARNWSETELMSIPGYRDRIVHIRLGAKEGGMNLDMPANVIKALKLRGRCAADLLIARFATSAQSDPHLVRPARIDLTWRNHQWIRFRAAAAAGEAFLANFSEQWAKSNGEYQSLLEAKLDDLPSYRWSAKQRDHHAKPTISALLRAVASWTEPYQTFDEHDGPSGRKSPRPKPEIRFNPPG